jgi:hypothetical protein
MMMVGRLSPRPCLLLLFSFYLVSYTSISSAFPVIPHQQTAQFSFTSAKQRFPKRRVFRNGNAAVTLLPTSMNAQTTRSTVHASPCRYTLRLSSSLRNQDDKDDVSSNLLVSTSTNSNNDIRKQEYQAQVEEMQRQRRNRAANISSSTQDLVLVGVACFLLLLGGFIIMTLKGEN